MYRYRTTGVCSNEIQFSIENNLVKNVKFLGGCPGSLEGLSHLIEGMPIKEAIQKLYGIKCGGKSTSCPDQLAHALMEIEK